MGRAAAFDPAGLSLSPRALLNGGRASRTRVFAVGSWTRFARLRVHHQRRGGFCFAANGYRMSAARDCRRDETKTLVVRRDRRVKARDYVLKRATIPFSSR